MKKLISLLLALTLIFGTQAAFAYDLGQKADFEPKTIRDSLIVSPPVYKIGTYEINPFEKKGRDITINLMAKDYEHASLPVKAMAALYDGSKNLEKIWIGDTTTLSATKGEESDISISIHMPDEDLTGYTLKTMVWSDIDSSLTPYVQSFDFPNGTVESDWTLNGWSVVRDSKVSDKMNTNEYCALKSTTSGETASKTFKVEPGSTSMVTFLARYEDGKSSASFTCNVYGKDGSKLGTYTFTHSDTSVNFFRDYYNYFNVPFNAGTNDSVTVEFVNEANYGVYVDDVVVSDNLIMNGSFNGNNAYFPAAYGNYWKILSPSHPYTFSTDSSVKLEGKSSLKISFNDPDHNNSLYQIVKSHIIEKAGTGTYVFSGYIKRDVLNDSTNTKGKIFPQLKQSGSFLQDAHFVSDLLTIYGTDKDSTGWHYFSVETEVSSIADIDVLLYINGGNNTIHVDDLRLVKKNNILKNADFEKGKTYWSMSEGDATVSAETEVVAFGLGSGKVSGRTSGAQAIAQNITPEAGKYAISGWIKTTNGGTPVLHTRIAYYATDGSTKLDDQFFYGVKGNNDWQYVSGVIDIPEAYVGDNLKWARFDMYEGSNNGLAGDFYVDNLRMFKIADL